MQDTVRVNWATKRVSAPPVWLAVVLQTLSTLLPTLAIEGLLLRMFWFDWKKNWKPFLLVNLVTQGALALFVSSKIAVYGSDYYTIVLGALLLLPVELIIAFSEAFLYRGLLQGHSKGWAFAYGLIANAVSYALGMAAVPLVWTFCARALWMGI